MARIDGAEKPGDFLNHVSLHTVALPSGGEGWGRAAERNGHRQSRRDAGYGQHRAYSPHGPDSVAIALHTAQV